MYSVRGIEARYARVYLDAVEDKADDGLLNENILLGRCVCGITRPYSITCVENHGHITSTRIKLLHWRIGNQTSRTLWFMLLTISLALCHLRSRYSNRTRPSERLRDARVRNITQLNSRRLHLLIDSTHTCKNVYSHNLRTLFRVILISKAFTSVGFG